MKISGAASQYAAAFLLTLVIIFQCDLENVASAAATSALANSTSIVSTPVANDTLNNNSIAANSSDNSTSPGSTPLAVNSTTNVTASNVTSSIATTNATTNATVQPTEKTPHTTDAMKKNEMIIVGVLTGVAGVCATVIIIQCLTYVRKLTSELFGTMS